MVLGVDSLGGVGGRWLFVTAAAEDEDEDEVGG